ncbi:MAG: class I SAM-dependent rRNA methyltransferase [Rhodospirillales bacterium]|jgi:23S rRNA (cytosine1962-C5)-methyltransferase
MNEKTATFDPNDTAQSEASPPDIFLLGGRDKRVSGGHPWVYSNEIRMDAAAKALDPGTAVTLRRVDGKRLGSGTFNPHTLIAYRQFSTDGTTVLDAEFLNSCLSRSLEMRKRMFGAPFYRLIHGEGDGLPGLIADRFGDTIVLQSGTAGMDTLLPQVLTALDRILAPKTVILRNDGAFRDLEQLNKEVRVLKGEVTEPIDVMEGSLHFIADPLAGQKTGWFFDQRPNRKFVARLSKDMRVLDLYCHTGGFAISAASAGAASVLGIDSSEPALDLAIRATGLNNLADIVRFEKDNVFKAMERLSASKNRFGIVIADPPAFVKSRKDLKPGLNGYRKLARMAAELVESKGYLFIASCSHNVDAAAFAEAVARGISQAGRAGRNLRAVGAGPDHPIHPHLSESAYLTTLTLQLD